MGCPPLKRTKFVKTSVLRAMIAMKKKTHLLDHIECSPVDYQFAAPLETVRLSLHILVDLEA